MEYSGRTTYIQKRMDHLNIPCLQQRHLGQEKQEQEQEDRHLEQKKDHFISKEDTLRVCIAWRVP